MAEKEKISLRDAKCPAFDGLFGVATSVAGPPDFSTITALRYAIAQHFHWLQVYLNAEIMHNPDVRRDVRERCQQADLQLIVHLPGLLTSDPATQASWVESARDLLSGQAEKFVVIHHDQRQDLPEAAARIRFWIDQGFTVCLENFHVVLSKQAGKAAYQKYVQVIENARQVAPEKIAAVLDIPRLYHRALDLESEAFDIWKDVFSELSRVRCRMFLHLIDISHPDSQREHWCAVGEGIIPYDRFVPLLHQQLLQAIIFEFEDLENPLKSREYLRNVLENPSGHKS